jgi:transposase
MIDMQAYSIDLRERIVNYVKGEHTKAEASRLFGVSWKTVCRYMKADSAGSLSPKPHGGGRRPKFTSEELERAVAKRRDSTLKEYAEIFNVSDVAIWKRLRRLSITLKKTLPLRGKGRG